MSAEKKLLIIIIISIAALLYFGSMVRDADTRKKLDSCFRMHPEWAREMYSSSTTREAKNVIFEMCMGY